MKVVARKEFKDFKENVTRNPGDEFIVNKARFEELQEKLAKFGPGPWVEEVKASEK